MIRWALNTQCNLWQLELGGQTRMAKTIYLLGNLITLAVIRTAVLGGSLEGVCYLSGVNDDCQVYVKHHHYIVFAVVICLLGFSAIIWDAKRLSLEREARSGRRKGPRE